MTLEEKYRRATEALRQIAEFGHVDGCDSNAPVHECCCYPKDEKEIAQEALKALEEL